MLNCMKIVSNWSLYKLQKEKQRKPKKRTYPQIIKELSYIVSPLFTNNAAANVCFGGARRILARAGA